MNGWRLSGIVLLVAMAALTVYGTWPNEYFWDNALWTGGYAILALLGLMALRTPADRFFGVAIAFAAFQVSVLYLIRTSTDHVALAVAIWHVMLLAPMVVGSIVASFFPARQIPRPHWMAAGVSLAITIAPALLLVALKFLADPY